MKFRKFKKEFTECYRWVREDRSRTQRAFVVLACTMMAIVYLTAIVISAFSGR